MRADHYPVGGFPDLLGLLEVIALSLQGAELPNLHADVNALRLRSFDQLGVLPAHTGSTFRLALLLLRPASQHKNICA